MQNLKNALLPVHVKFLSFIVLIAIIVGCNNSIDSEKIDGKTLNKILNERFTGELAYETTDFVEDFWRVRGNKGYNASIDKVVAALEKSGFVNEDIATADDRLTYRLEKRPMKLPTWEPIDASLTIVGEDSPLLKYPENRHMIALNSFSTPVSGVEAEIVKVSSEAEIYES